MLFLVDEKRALYLLDLRRVYWTATNVKVDTICVHVVANSREFENPRTASEREGVYASQAFV